MLKIFPSLITILVTFSCSTDTVTNSTENQTIKAAEKKIESVILNRLVAYEKDLASGISPDEAFQRFKDLSTDGKDNIYIIVNTNGNDSSVELAIRNLGGSTRQTIAKEFYCLVRPDIIRRISLLQDVVLIGASFPPELR